MRRAACRPLDDPKKMPEDVDFGQSRGINTRSHFNAVVAREIVFFVQSAGYLPAAATGEPAPAERLAPIRRGLEAQENVRDESRRHRAGLRGPPPRVRALPG